MVLQKMLKKDPQKQVCKRNETMSMKQPYITSNIRSQRLIWTGRVIQTDWVEQSGEFTKMCQ